MLGNAEDAEDAAQESFWRAYQGLAKYDFQRSFGTWLLSITAHYCIDRLRRKRINALSLESLLPEDDAPDETPGPEHLAGAKEDREAVQVLLAGLHAEERAMVVMRYWYDMSYDEIGKAFSCSVGAVKSRLHRARQSLAAAMQPGRKAAGAEGGSHG